MILGFLGTGNMGGTLAAAAAKGQGVQLLLANRHPEKAEALAARIGGQVVTNEELFRRADYVFLGVKPGMVASVLAQAVPVLRQRQEKPVLVSMAAGISLEQLQTYSENLCPLIRIMPSMPAAVGEGVTLYACSDAVSEEAKNGFLKAMEHSGRLVPLEEPLFSAGMAVSGCGSAYAALFLEGLADGGVACGLSRKLAYEMAAQMLLGSARWLLEMGELPANLKDKVCSPGGTTIQGVRALEERGFRSAAMEAVIAACEADA